MKYIPRLIAAVLFAFVFMYPTLPGVTLIGRFQEYPEALPAIAGLFGGILGYSLVVSLQRTGRMRGAARVLGGLITGLVFLFGSSTFLYDLGPFYVAAAGLVLGYLAVGGVQHLVSRRAPPPLAA